MKSVYFKPQTQPQQRHRRGQIMRYNSVDNCLLASPYDLTAFMYSNTNQPVVPSHYPRSHNPVQLQPQPQLPLLPFPVATVPQHFMSLPLIHTSSGKLNRTTRKPKSHDHSAGNSKNNYQKIKEASKASCVAKEHLVSKKMTLIVSRSGEQDARVVSELVFALSPDPSSVPLPKFYMKQIAAKLSCTAEGKAGGSSTEVLRRVLQLQ